MTKDELLALIKTSDCEMSFRQKLHLTVLLAVPAIIAQMSFIIMQIIDASMLGHLSTDEAAAVGLVSTTIWLFGGLASAFASGVSVQVAHKVGACDYVGARSIIRQGMVLGVMFAVFLTLVALCISPYLPYWLGADENICYMATEYFSIFSCAITLIVCNNIAAGSLRCSGNIKVPSFLMVMMCFLDVFFNYLFIFVCHMGTAGAAYGTAVAYFITMLCMIYYMVMKDPILNFKQDLRLDFRPNSEVIRNGLKIGTPIGIERGIMCTAQVTISSIIAPLGNIAIAANTFAINVESICYMPGHGISEAVTTLVGQSKGAQKPHLMRSFAWICMITGMMIMALMGILMWIFAPQMLSIVTPDNRVVELGTEILRIEAWAEPGFAAAIVGMGAFLGAGNTLVPSMMNLFSIWGVRVTLTLLLAPMMGLRGVWIAMAIELIFRGLIFVLRLYKKFNRQSII